MLSNAKLHEERSVADLLVRNVDPAVIERLKARAARQGRSLQSELKDIVERAAATDIAQARALADRIRKRLKEQRTDSADLIAQDRER